MDRRGIRSPFNLVLTSLIRNGNLFDCDFSFRGDTLFALAVSSPRGRIPLNVAATLTRSFLNKNAPLHFEPSIDHGGVLFAG